MHARRQEGSVSTCGVRHNRRTGSGSAVSQARKQCPQVRVLPSGCAEQTCAQFVVCVALVVAYLCLSRTTQTRHQMHSALMPNLVVCKGAFVLKLPPCVDETMLVGWDTLLDLDLHLHILDGVIRGKPRKGDYLPSQGLDDDLHVLYKMCGVHLPSKKTNSLWGGSRGECRDACSQAGRERLHMWCVAQPTDRVRVCCVSSTEAVSTQCHTRSG